MITLLGRTLRRYAILLMLTSITGSLSVADRPTAQVTPVAITIKAPHHDTPALPAGVSVVPGRFLVRGTLPLDLSRSLGARPIRRLLQTGWREFAAAASASEAVSTVRAAGLEAEPVYAGILTATTPDTCTTPGCAVDQWQYDATAASTTWSASPSADQVVTVAVLDTKIDRSHPDWVRTGGTGPSLAEGGQLRLDAARDLVNDHTGSAAYHGTFVAGLVAASANGRDAIGVAPRGVAILPITVVDGSGRTDSATLADGILGAWQAGARVINLSLGILGDSSAVRDAIRLVTNGTDARSPALVVAAAGNNTGAAAFYPGSYPEVMSVAGTSREDGPATCSNFNSNVSVSAPADRLVGLAPMPQRLLQAPCGTSAAAPQVSGIAALLFAQDPSRTPQQVRTIIESTSDDLGIPGRDDRFGAGRLNAARALASGASARVQPAAMVGGRDSTITSTVSAASNSGPLQAAEARVGSGEAPPIALEATDGSFDSGSEQLRLTLSLRGLTAGTHRVFVRAKDASGWGAYTPIVVTVDATPPTIANLTASNAVRGIDPLRVNFTATDAASARLVYAIEIVATATGQRQVSPATWVQQGPQGYSWSLPASLAPGHYRVVLAVADESGNTARAEAGTIIA